MSVSQKKRCDGPTNSNCEWQMQTRHIELAKHIQGHGSKSPSKVAGPLQKVAANLEADNVKTVCCLIQTGHKELRLRHINDHKCKLTHWYSQSRFPVALKWQ